MAETMAQLKRRAKIWPEPWGSHARELMRDAHFDLILCQRQHVASVVEDLRQALLATELEMRGAYHAIEDMEWEAAMVGCYDGWEEEEDGGA